MTRGIAYRRAQQNRMTAKAMKIVRAEDWFWIKYLGGEWVTVKVYNPRVEAKKQANNLASYKRRQDRERPIAELKADLSARQELEEYNYDILPET